MRFGVLAAVLVRMHNILGCDTVLLGKQFAKFQRVKVPSKCQEAFTQQHSVTSQKNDILKRPQDGHSKFQTGSTLHVPAQCIAHTELWLRMPLQCTVKYRRNLMLCNLNVLPNYSHGHIHCKWTVPSVIPLYSATHCTA